MSRLLELAANIQRAKAKRLLDKALGRGDFKKEAKKFKDKAKTKKDQEKVILLRKKRKRMLTKEKDVLLKKGKLVDVKASYGIMTAV